MQIWSRNIKTYIDRALYGRHMLLSNSNYKQDTYFDLYGGMAFAKLWKQGGRIPCFSSHFASTFLTCWISVESPLCHFSTLTAAAHGTGCRADENTRVWFSVSFFFINPVTIKCLLYDNRQISYISWNWISLQPYSCHITNIGQYRPSVWKIKGGLYSFFGDILVICQLLTLEYSNRNHEILVFHICIQK